ncbi:MAG: cupin domain-containing protein [Mariprofundus sp.]|nr:cupin domain-containing protein [Mariprofundus sp.]
MKLVKLDEIEPDHVNHAANIARRILLSEHDLPGSVRLSHALFKAGESIEPHKHDDLCEVFYLLSGQGVLRVEGLDMMISPGSTFMIAPGEVHQLTNSGDSDMTMIYFALLKDD